MSASTRSDGRPEFADVAAAELDRVYRYLLQMLRNPTLAEDVCSATFERAWRDWHRFDPARGRPGVWLIEVARRQALDHLRSSGRRRRRETAWFATEPRSASEPDVSGLSPQMRSALTALTDQERELVALRVLLGFTTDESASITGMSRTGVSSALHRSMAKLRRRLEGAPDA
ncbi:MAG: sigma-70 family RNA polymerase sigma factor [Thermoleophilia bacterium]|nr:sigma-70 family RNA polymerase sigma factor [Thermoleophilia bacterium]